MRSILLTAKNELDKVNKLLNKMRSCLCFDDKPYFRGTKLPFSVKYLFEEWNIAYKSS